MKPITREEMYLAAAAGYDVAPPEPITRKEVFLAKLAGMEVETPVPFTRRERFIEEAAVNGSGGGVTINNQDITVTENGRYTADEGYTGLGTVTVDVPDIPPVLEEKQISRNGTYTPSAGVDGFRKVTVNVEDIPAVLQEKTFTKNGSYTPDTGYEGMSKVTVAVPDPVVKPLTVEKNGVYNLPSDADGYGPVTVNVPDIPPVLQEKSTTKNGTVTPDSGYDGLSKVTVNVPDVPAVVTPLNVTKNGTYTAPEGVDGYNPVTVAVPAPEIKLQDITITENGEYTADSGFDGLGKVSVEVKGSGGGSLPVGLYFKTVSKKPYTGGVAFTLNKKIYFVSKEQYADTKYHIFLLEDGNFIKKVPDAFDKQWAGVEYNGKVHFTGRDSTNHYCWDGVSETIETLNNLPKATRAYGFFVVNGKLYASAYNSTSNLQRHLIYCWDEQTDTWQDTGLLNYSGGAPIAYKGKAYVWDSNKLYELDFDAGTMKTVKTDMPQNVISPTSYVLGDYAYIFSGTGYIEKLDMKNFSLVSSMPNYASGAWPFLIEDQPYISNFLTSTEFFYTIYDISE